MEDFFSKKRSLYCVWREFWFVLHSLAPIGIYRGRTLANEDRGVIREILSIMIQTLSLQLSDVSKLNELFRIAFSLQGGFHVSWLCRDLMIFVSEYIDVVSPTLRCSEAITLMLRNAYFDVGACLVRCPDPPIIS